MYVAPERPPAPVVAEPEEEDTLEDLEELDDRNDVPVDEFDFDSEYSIAEPPSASSDDSSEAED